jgi:hypothetical protein
MNRFRKDYRNKGKKQSQNRENSSEIQLIRREIRVKIGPAAAGIT